MSTNNQRNSSGSFSLFPSSSATVVVVIASILLFFQCFTILGQQAKPDGSKLKLFTSYHTASLGAGALLYKVIIKHYMF